MEQEYPDDNGGFPPINEHLFFHAPPMQPMMIPVVDFDKNQKPMNIATRADRVFTAENQLDIEQTESDMVQAGMMFNKKLHAWRVNNPHLSISPLPNSVLCFVSAAIGVAQNINLPNGTKAVRFKGNADYYVDRNGAAAVPSVTVDGSTQSNAASSIYKPEETLMYVEEIKQISIVAPAVGTIVTIQCFQQQ